MHVANLAELASTLAQAGPAILHQHHPIAPEAVSAYWVTSRSRIDLWHQSLARYQRIKATGDSIRLRHWWDHNTCVLEEILVSELLTRVVVALAHGIDQRAGVDDFSPIAQSILMSHLEARNRVQRAILDRRGCSVADAVRLNQLRRLTERWIDTYIGMIAAGEPSLMRYGIDQNRLRAHTQSIREQGSDMAQRIIHSLMRFSMVDALRKRLPSEPALPSSNQAVADAVLLMLRPELFDSVGMLKSLWMHRIANNAQKTDKMIDQWMLPSVDVSTTDALDAIHDKALLQWFRQS